MQNDIRLCDLAYATFQYTNMSKDDASLEKLREQIGEHPNLKIDSQVKQVIVWLRKWKCRNFELMHEAESLNSIKYWYKKYEDTLENLPSELPLYEAADFNTLAVVFDEIAKSNATQRKLIGPTAASKMLYLLKPSALPPWDNPIRIKLHYNGSGESYVSFVKKCQQIEKDIIEQCKYTKYQIADLINHGGDRKISIVKAIDEYYWLTITNDFKLPTLDDFEMWLKLGKLGK